jgi:DsbC/DsbD-like thiol-disulfide interchange protein
MKHWHLPLLLVLCAVMGKASQAQINPVTFSYALSKTDYKAGDTVDFIITAKIEKGWCIYSSEFEVDGPIRFDCLLEKNDHIIKAGPITAYKPFQHFDETWEGQIKLFEGMGQFRIPLVIKKTGKLVLKGEIEGQACKDVCVPINAKVEVDVSTLPKGAYEAVDPSVYDHYQEHGK